MSTRLRNLIIVVGAILAIVIIWFFFFRGQPTITQDEPATVVETEEPEVTFVPVVPSVVPPAPLRQDNAERLTIFFVERYGSYSNQSPYSNLEGLDSVATASFSADLLAMQQEPVSGIPDMYVGVSTRVLSVSVIDESDTEARVIASTQRVESRESKDNSNRYFQDIELILKKVDGNWAVDRARWL